MEIHSQYLARENMYRSEKFTVVTYIGHFLPLTLPPNVRPTPIFFLGYNANLVRSVMSIVF